MSEAWYKEYCPKCNTINWICNGDESDLSGIDIIGYKCRKCGNKVLFETNDNINIEDYDLDLGLEKPY